MTLNEALSIVNNKKFFAYRDQDEKYFRRMMRKFIETETGRRLLAEVTPLLKQKGAHVFLSMTEPNDDNYGETYSDLHVLISHIDTGIMSQKQKDRTLVTQAGVLAHELTHIKQFLTGREAQEASFPLPHQLYAYLLHEAEAMVAERSYQLEMGQLYPSLAASMHLQQDSPNWREKYVRSFFLEKNPRVPVSSWTDGFIDSSWDVTDSILISKKEQNIFRQWVETVFKAMKVDVKYDEVSLDKMFGVENLGGGYFLVQGEDTEVEFDKDGRVVYFCRGLLGEKESDIQYLFPMVHYDRKRVNALARRVRKLYPQASVMRADMNEKAFEPRQFYAALCNPIVGARSLRRSIIR